MTMLSVTNDLHRLKLYSSTAGVKSKWCSLNFVKKHMPFCLCVLNLVLFSTCILQERLALCFLKCLLDSAVQDDISCRFF